MTTAPFYLALDVGAAVTRIATLSTRIRTITDRTPAGTIADRVRAALRMAPGRPSEVCVTVPDAWFSGSVRGARSYEEIRSACEDQLGLRGVIWTGQLAAVAARCGRQQGPGRYLVCDVGYAGVRTGSFAVGDGTVRTEAIFERDGGGWRDFDRAFRAVAGADPLPEKWYEQAVEQAGQAFGAFSKAMASPDREDDQAYRLTGHRDHPLTVRQMMDCFAPVRERLEAGLAAASGGGAPGTVVLTGGLGWFPLANLTVRKLTGIAPTVTGLNESVRGALLMASREVIAEPPAGRATVSLPMNRIQAGLLEEAALELPWDRPFAEPPGGTLPLDSEELVLMISGQYRTVRLPGLVPGPYRIGVRAGWSVPGVLVVRPAADGAVQVVSLPPAGPAGGHGP
jgi:hypothetical protein